MESPWRVIELDLIYMHTHTHWWMCVCMYFVFFSFVILLFLLQIPIVNQLLMCPEWVLGAVRLLPKYLFTITRLLRTNRFVLYKLPATSLKDSSSSSNGKDKSDGRAYVYRTSAHTSDIKSNSPSWIASVHPIDSPTSLPGQTLTPLYAFPDVSPAYVYLFPSPFRPFIR